MKKLLTFFSILTCLISRGQTVTDIDGNIYNTVTVGTQIWTVENLKTTKYSNGIPIQYVSTDSLWSGFTTPAFCTYNNNLTYRAVYGNLYNFYAVIDSQNVCPTYWHVPSDNEWNILINFLGGDSVAGGKLKETGLTHWQSQNTGASNSSGLTVLPAGYRYSNYGFNPGMFHGLNGNGAIWTSTSTTDSTALAKYFYPGSASVGLLDFRKRYGMSIRCIANVLTGIQKSEKAKEINVFPNPTSDQFVIETNSTDKLFVDLYDINGRHVYSKSVSDKSKIDIANLDTGIYTLTIKIADSIITKKLVIIR